MCTAYELGQRSGRSFPDWMMEDGIEALLDLRGQTIIRPTLPAPVVMPDGMVRTMGWGFRRMVPGAKGKLSERTIVNSREDKLQGRTWKEAFQQRRCLIPASAFFEWVDGPRGKIPLRFERPEQEWLWIAGIWEEDRDRGEVFSMITTDPAPAIAPIHDRMPAVLPMEQLRCYLDGELHAFGPSRVPLQWTESANFLKKTPDQGELF